MGFLRKYFGIIVVLVLSFWAIKPLFVPGFFPMHDDTQVARVFEMGKMLQSGMFPVRWVPDLGYGYGYPIFNFYAPLAYYVGGFFTLLGFDALIATKIMMLVGIILAGIFMYLLAREFWGELGGIVSSLFYIYAPYHALDIYVRGDVAEVWAYGLIPLMFFGFYKLYQQLSIKNDLPPIISNFKFQISNFYVWKWVVVGSLGYAGVILSHNLTAMMVTPFITIVILLYCFIAYRNKKLFIIYCLVFTILLGLMLSAFYWIPALLEMKYTNVLSQIGGGADFRNHFICLGQLWDSQWGFGGSAQGCIDGLSFKIGKLHILLALAAFLFGANQFLKKKSERTLIIGFSVLGLLVSVFLMLEISKPVWEAIPAMAFFQYPWRFLLLASFFSSLACGSLVFFLTKFKVKPYFTAAVLVFFVLFFNTKLFAPQTIYQKTVADYTNERALKWVASRTSDEFLPPDFKKPKSEHEIAENPIPFEETNIQKVANLISLLGIVIMTVGIIKLIRR